MKKQSVVLGDLLQELCDMYANNTILKAHKKATLSVWLPLLKTLASFNSICPLLPYSQVCMLGYGIFICFAVFMQGDYNLLHLGNNILLRLGDYATMRGPLHMGDYTWVTTRGQLHVGDYTRVTMLGRLCLDVYTWSTTSG